MPPPLNHRHTSPSRSLAQSSTPPPLHWPTARHLSPPHPQRAGDPQPSHGAALPLSCFLRPAALPDRTLLGRNCQVIQHGSEALRMRRQVVIGSRPSKPEPDRDSQNFPDIFLFLARNFRFLNNQPTGTGNLEGSRDPAGVMLSHYRPPVPAVARRRASL